MFAPDIFMLTVSKITISKLFFMKMYKFWLRFQKKKLFLRVNLTIFQHYFRYGMAQTRRQANISTIDAQIIDAYMHLSASMG